MSMIKGPGLFLAQFAGDDAPFNGLGPIVNWAADLGYKGVQIPSWDGRLFDLAKAAESDAYCDEVRGVCADAGVEITELSTHLQGQLVAVHPAFDEGFDAFAVPEVRGNPKARQAWAVDQMKLAAKASSAGSGSTITCPFHRCARLALCLSVAAEPGRSHRGGVRRACRRAGSRSWMCSTSIGVECRLRDPSGRGSSMTASASRCSWSASATIRAAGSTTIPAISFCSSSTISASSTSISGAHLRFPREGRRIQPEPEARASIRATSPGSSSAARFRSLGDGQVDFKGDFLEDAGERL